ncbi:MAG: S8 family serine peptidase [Candidatus Magasanikbacteria bacterium]|nr:S8 family serine peptidase [Candidatus Magasanikbacteria bacterium]
MLRLYHNLAKKSMVLALLASVVLFSDSALALTPNDPSFINEQTMWNQIGAPRAWDFTTGSRRVTIATIDTGADIWHDDLISNIWTNPYEIPDNNYDDDGDGYIDDIHGWNFIEDNNSVRPSVLENTGDPGAINHGTVIAGLLGAVGNNNKTAVGLNWHVSLMSLRAVGSDGNGSYAKVAQAVQFAVDHGADVISMSIVGDQYDETLKQVLYNAYKKGVVIVAAAGNDQNRNGGGNLNQKPNYPVCFDSNDLENWMVGVSSVDNQDRLSRFADYGSCVDILAPGQDIFSLERYAPVYGYNEDFGGPWQGTSFAAPLVAGAAALIKAEHPEWTAKDIINDLFSTADNIDSKNPQFQGMLGFGRLNIGQAMYTAASTKFPNNYSAWKQYSFKGNTVYTIENGINYFFGSTAEATIVSLAATRSFDGKHDEVVVLVRRGKQYFVQFFNDTGLKWQEKAVPVSDYSIANLPVKITAINTDIERDVQVSFSQKITKKVKKGKKIVTQTTTKNTLKFYDWLAH